MASRGAPLVNPADLVVDLIVCGHTPRDAEVAAGGLDAWRDADPEVVDYYAQAPGHDMVGGVLDARPPVARAVVDAAVRWAMHRRARH